MKPIKEFCSDTFEFLSKGIAQRQLESELARIVRTAAAHKKNQIPQGDPRYQSLNQIANQKVDSFCEKHSVARATIEAQIPALTELADLAKAPTARTGVGMSLGVTAGTIISIVAIGFGSGLIHFLFTTGYHWAYAAIQRL